MHTTMYAEGYKRKCMTAPGLRVTAFSAASDGPGLPKGRPQREPLRSQPAAVARHLNIVVWRERNARLHCYSACLQPAVCSEMMNIKVFAGRESGGCELPKLRHFTRVFRPVITEERNGLCPGSRKSWLR